VQRAAEPPPQKHSSKQLEHALQSDSGVQSLEMRVVLAARFEGLLQAATKAARDTTRTSFVMFAPLPGI
jgi:hypothetical protein